MRRTLYLATFQCTDDDDRCVFPFWFGTTRHLSCIPYRGRTWCSTTAVYIGRWGYCGPCSSKLVYGSGLRANLIFHQILT